MTAFEAILSMAFLLGHLEWTKTATFIGLENNKLNTWDLLLWNELSLLIPNWLQKR